MLRGERSNSWIAPVYLGPSHWYLARIGSITSPNTAAALVPQISARNPDRQGAMDVEQRIDRHGRTCNQEQHEKPAQAVLENAHECQSSPSPSAIRELSLPARQVPGPNDIAAYRCWQHQIEEHADEIETDEATKWLAIAQRTSKELPAQAAQNLSDNIKNGSQQPQVDIQSGEAIAYLVPVSPPNYQTQKSCTGDDSYDES